MPDVQNANHYSSAQKTIGCPINCEHCCRRIWTPARPLCAERLGWHGWSGQGPGSIDAAIASRSEVVMDRNPGEEMPFELGDVVSL
jgi:hypothetical protein